MLAVAALGYLASALARARLLGPAGRASDMASAFGGASQGAIGIAAALATGAMLLRFDGPREVIALLLTAEMLVVAGLMFGDRVVRGFGAGVAGVVVLRAIVLVEAGRSMLMWPWAMHVWAPAVALVALVFYVNREVIRSRGLAPFPIERAYAPAASFLVVQVLWGETPAPYLGLALLAAASVLIEGGLRRAAEYRYQGYAIAVLGLMVVLGLRDIAAVWRVMPAAFVLAYAAAARLGLASRAHADARDLRHGAGAAACAGTASSRCSNGWARPIHVAAWAATGSRLWRRRVASHAAARAAGTPAGACRRAQAGFA